MANDSFSIRNTPHLERSASGVDLGQLVSKNQSVKGDSLLDGLFGASAESSFSKVLDSQVKREPPLRQRAPDREAPPPSDKAGRPSGKNSPQDRQDTRADARAADDAASKKPSDTPARMRSDAKTEESEGAGARANKHKPGQKSEKSRPTEEANAGRAAEPSAPAQDNVTPVEKPVDAAPTEALQTTEEGAGIRGVLADAQSTDVLALAQQRAAVLPLAASSDATSEASGLGVIPPETVLKGVALAATPAGKGDGNVNGRITATVDPSLLAAMQATDPEAEVDPALKDLMNAMMNASAVPAGQADGDAASGAAAPEDALASLARQLNAQLSSASTSVDPDGHVDTTVPPSVEDFELMAQPADMTEITLGEEEGEVTATVAGEAESTAVADDAVESLLAETGEAQAEEPVEPAAGSERQTKAPADKAAAVMTSASQAADDGDSWSILDKMADALPKHMPKETVETLKNVTPQVQSEQQMAMVRDELRSLQRFVDSGLQAASRPTRDTGSDDKGLEVKTANLSRAIENLTGTVKATELRTPLPMSNAPVAFGRAGFAEQMAEKIMLMTTQKVQSAEIRLDPKELGAVEVKIRMHQDQASVVFSSPHAQVRDALESSIPRLREMFAESGLGLGNVNVNDRGGSSTGGNEQSQGQGGNGAYGGSDEVVEERPQRLPRQPNGLVDYYA